jgi:3-hydroxyacyl-CoA dehydrogenase
MAERCNTAAVVGAGVMGSAIAAHLAGAGIKTYLLDIVPPSLSPQDASNRTKRNGFALGGVEKALKAKPAAFYDPDAARLITCGNLEDDLGVLAGCDLVVEAVVERLDIKQPLLKKVAAALGPHTVLASNTSGLSIASLCEGLPRAVQERMLVMHFFNPVRYMRLLELVPGPHTSAATMAYAEAVGSFLGKGIVFGKDTTNFVANRIGVHGLMSVFKTMETEGLTIEEVDKIFGKPLGRPSSAAFRTADIVGIDTFVHVAKNCYDALPNDEERTVFKTPAWLDALLSSGRLGQKTGAGFYKKVGSDILVLDLKTMDYRPQNKVRFESLADIKNIENVGERIKALVSFDDPAGRFAWKVLSRSLCYTAKRVGEIADDIVNIDRAMCWGFNWDLGPFQTWDALGVRASAEKMQREGLHVPGWVLSMLDSGQSSFYAGHAHKPMYFDVKTHQPSPVPYSAQHIRLEALHAQPQRVIKENMGASLVDVGDGCVCLEVHTKMNTIDGDVIEMMASAVETAERNFEALVIANDGQHFGAGANLMMIYMAIQSQDWAAIDHMVRTFQQAAQQLRYAKVPVVAAPFQYTFGGACEIAMACDAVQAHAETYMGLPEVGVGIVPAGGGCLRLVERYTSDIASIENADLLPAIGQASLNVAMAKISTGAHEAVRLRFMLPTDGISLNRDHLLMHAKQRALGLARAGYTPPRAKMLKAAGYDAAKTISTRIWSMVEGGYASAHDALIAHKVAHIMCGGCVSAGTRVDEQHYLDLEREAFLSLCGEEKSQARMQSILMSNKPLRN